MSMMDTHAKKGEEAYKNACKYFDYAGECILERDLDSAYHEIRKADGEFYRSMENWYSAYVDAETPYKEFIRMQLNILIDFKKAIDCRVEAIIHLRLGEVVKDSVYIKQARKYKEQTCKYVKMIQKKVQKQNEFLKRHPEVKEHIIEKWGIEESDLRGSARAPLLYRTPPHQKGTP